MTALGLGLGLPFGGRISNPLASLGAVFAIDARNSFSGEQAAVNFGTGGSALNAQYGSTTGVDTNDPLLLTHTGSNYLYLPGTAGNYASSPDAAVLDLSSAIEMVARIQPADWTPGADSVIVGKRSSGTTSSYQLTFLGTNELALRLSFDGTALVNLGTTPMPFADNVAGWVKGTWRSSDGAWAVSYAADSATEPTSWTVLSSGTSSAGSTIFNSASAIEIGCQGVSTSSFFTGRIYRTIIRSSVGGTTVFDADFSRNSAQNSFSEFSSNAATVTVNRSTSGRKSAIVTRPVWLIATDDYFEVAESSLLDFDNVNSFTALVVTRTHANSVSDGFYIGKYAGGIELGWALYNTTSPGRTNYAWLADTSVFIDGTTNMPATAGSNGDISIRAMRYNATADQLTTSYNNVNGAVQSTAIMSDADTMANNRPMNIGRQVLGSYANDLELLSAAVFRKALTAGEIAQIVSYYGAA